MSKNNDMREVNEAYMAEDYDRYEAMIERYAKRYGQKPWQFGDDCTDQRLLGPTVTRTTQNLTRKELKLP